VRARLAARRVSERLGPLRWPGRTREAWIDRKKGAAYEPPVFVLPNHDVRTAGPVPDADPSGLSPVARERRRLARRLAAELTTPPVPHTPGHDLVSAHAISLPVSELASVEDAMRQAVLVPLRTPNQVWVTEGDGGHITFLHGDTFSIVYRMHPAQSPILVLVDELPGYAVRVDEDDSQRGRIMIVQMVMGVMINLQSATLRASA